ncbi:DUF4062 domain-containing protein [Prevotella sp. lc2012]|uniref:DUF4062 domain-containing protein n=1 Tax=Prevotella sp. lc2012 TaxID=1761886 RepID=UPI000897BBA5|nr:DUF4062 domain-containing protein [Prevotella sp. lc2012]SEE42748.1 protein of unknown function [Prevotella sp. lc2012]
MDKRYQIFISSTFSDLKEERNKVMQTIMSLDCIPAGMELFPAMDEEQFDFIKRVIDDCDYYLLIVGARYGSMDDNGVSYTEKEYDYAKEKGIPVMAFLHKDISSIPLGKADTDAVLKQKLENFRKKVETGKLVKYWDNADELNALVAISLPKTIKMFPRTGWVRANLQTNAESLQEINQLQKELSELREFKAKQDQDLSQLENNLKDRIAGLETIATIPGQNKHFDYKKHKDAVTTWKAQLSIKEIFEKLALYMIDNSLSDTQVRNRIARISFESTGKNFDRNDNCQIELKTYQQIRLHLKLLGLIEMCTIPECKSIYWQLSHNGKALILNSLCFFKDKNQ